MDSLDLTAFETLFRALADRTRLRILALLAGGEICVCDIYETLGIPQAKASRHLAYLRRAGLVATRRQGLWVHYRLAPATEAVRRVVMDAVEHALGHLASVDRDRRRLERRTGCCRPGKTTLALAPACCAPPRPPSPASSGER